MSKSPFVSKPTASPFKSRSAVKKNTESALDSLTFRVQIPDSKLEYKILTGSRHWDDDCLETFELEEDTLYGRVAMPWRTLAPHLEQDISSVIAHFRQYQDMYTRYEHTPFNPTYMIELASYGLFIINAGQQDDWQTQARPRDRSGKVNASYSPDRATTRAYIRFAMPKAMAYAFAQHVNTKTEKVVLNAVVISDEEYSSLNLPHPLLAGKNTSGIGLGRYSWKGENTTDAEHDLIFQENSRMASNFANSVYSQSQHRAIMSVLPVSDPDDYTVCCIFDPVVGSEINDPHGIIYTLFDEVINLN
jgi:hypothetical protein